MHERFDFCRKGVGFSSSALTPIELYQRARGGEIQRIDGHGFLQMPASTIEIAGLRESGSSVAFVDGRSGGELSGTLEGDFGFAGFVAQKQRLSDPGEEFGIVGELRLDFGEFAIALDDHRLRAAADAGIDVSYAEVAFLQSGSRLSPGDDVGARGEIGFGLGPTLDAVIGEGGVAAVLGVPAGHVATDAVGVFYGMR